MLLAGSTRFLFFCPHRGATRPARNRPAPKTTAASGDAPGKKTSQARSWKVALPRLGCSLVSDKSGRDLKEPHQSGFRIALGTRAKTAAANLTPKSESGTGASTTP
jgi:hypothetical protein